MRTVAQNQNRQSVFSTSTRPTTTTSESNRNRHPVLDLQSVIGNQAVMRMMRAGAEETNEMHPLAAGPIQTKLAINKPGDEFEQEADTVADQVMRMPESQLQRSCDCGVG